jgi:preprotein translocase subunit SecG
MLDKILFWVVLVWMIGMLVMAIIAVKEVWQEASKSQADADDIDSPPKKDPNATGQKNDQTAG